MAGSAMSSGAVVAGFASRFAMPRWGTGGMVAALIGLKT